MTIPFDPNPFLFWVEFTTDGNDVGWHSQTQINSLIGIVEWLKPDVRPSLVQITSLVWTLSGITKCGGAGDVCRVHFFPAQMRPSSLGG